MATLGPAARRPLIRREPSKGYWRNIRSAIMRARNSNGSRKERTQAFGCRQHHIVQLLYNQVPMYLYEFRDRTAPFYFPVMPRIPFLAHTIPATANTFSRVITAAR